MNDRRSWHCVFTRGPFVHSRGSGFCFLCWCHDTICSVGFIPIAMDVKHAGCLRFPSMCAQADKDVKTEWAFMIYGECMLCVYASLLVCPFSCVTTSQCKMVSYGLISEVVQQCLHRNVWMSGFIVHCCRFYSCVSVVGQCLAEKIGLAWHYVFISFHALLLCLALHPSCFRFQQW